jgi:hypothetical protein
MSAFDGLNASNEELKLKAQNCWAFSKEDCGDSFVKYMDLPREEALTMQPPFLFISFPSAKDPNWDKHPVVRARAPALSSVELAGTGSSTSKAQPCTSAVMRTRRSRPPSGKT